MKHVKLQAFPIAVAMGLIGLGCGSTSSPGASTSPVVTGVASAGSPVVSVSLRDSATPPSTLTATPDASGAFSFDTAKLTPPFFLKAEASSGPVYAIATQGGTTNVNEITTAVCAGSSESEDAEDCEGGWAGHDSHSSERSGGIAKGLAHVLKPLLDLYGITGIGEGDDDAAKHASGDSSHLAALLRDVSFTVKLGVVTVANRATGAVIFVGPLRHLDQGIFYPENMPAGPVGTTPGACTYTYGDWGTCLADGTQTRTVVSATPVGCVGTPVLSQACAIVPPPVNTCTSFTYSAFGACQPDGTQTRTVLSSSPAGCTGGSPVLSQACTVAPPPADGAALYTQSCQSCHGALATSNLRGKNVSLASIIASGMRMGLTDAQLQAVATAVGP
jgi:hypothetical protein